MVVEPLQQASSAGPRSQQQALDAAVSLMRRRQHSVVKRASMPMLDNLVGDVAPTISCGFTSAREAHSQTHLVAGLAS